MNGSGIYLEFEPPIPVCSGTGCFFTYPWNETVFLLDEATDNNRVFLEMPNGRWMIARMRGSANGMEMAIAREKENTSLSMCSNETVSAGNLTWHMVDIESHGSYKRLILNSTEKGILLLISEGEFERAGGEYIFARRLIPGYTFCNKMADVSVLSEIINLTDPSSGAILVWEDENAQNPALVSISVPRYSQAYGKLTDPLVIKNNISGMVETQIYEGYGLEITLEPGIPVFDENDWWCDDDRYCYAGMIENKEQSVFLLGNEYDIALLRGPESRFSYYIGTDNGSYVEGNMSGLAQALVLGRGKPSILNQCERTSINGKEYALRVGTGRMLLDENSGGCTAHFCCNEYYSLPFGSKRGILLNETDSLKQVDGNWVKMKFAMPVDYSWAQFAVYDEIVNMTDPGYNITLVFRNESSDNPVLSRISIPASSPLFEKMNG